MENKLVELGVTLSDARAAVAKHVTIAYEESNKSVCMAIEQLEVTKQEMEPMLGELTTTLETLSFPDVGAVEQWRKKANELCAKSWETRCLQAGFRWGKSSDTSSRAASASSRTWMRRAT